jgi:hypothetical protein
MVYMSLPIEKAEDTKTVNPVDGTPDLLIAGKATDGTIDSDLQVVDPAWSLAAIKTWFDTKGNVRFQHDASKPVGKGIEVDGHYVKALIADPKAKHFIRTGVLNDFSVGIMNPDIRRGDPAFKHLDPAGKAVNGVITGRPDGLSAIGEISVVDRGSNFGTKFSLCKAAADGTPEWTGELTAPDDVLAKVAKPAKGKTVTVELPKNMSLSVKPSDLAKLATFRQKLVQDKAAEPEVVTKATEPDDPELESLKSAESVVYKRDIDTATRRRLAGEGNALADGSYPIENAGDLHNAAHLAQSGHGNAAGAKRLISRRAKELGVPNPLKGGKDKKGKTATKSADPQVTKCKCGDTGMMDGKPCPSCKKGKKAAKKAKRQVRKALGHLDDFASVVNDSPVTKKKKSRVVCGGCGAKQNAKHDACSECGKPMSGAMPVAKNHDYVCLGCGKALDKGEKHCPGCGKENPGFNPMADHKIPMNADKAAKERVTKRKKAKSGKDSKPMGDDGDGKFGGKKAKPFGAKDEPAEGEKPKAKKNAKPKTVKRKGKGKGRSPAAGVKGQEGSTMPLPAHREPDGPPVEMFERDTHLQDGDEGQEMAAAMRHKFLAASGMTREDALLHDLTCPAFTPEAVAKAFPYATFGAIDDGSWREKMLADAAGAPLDKAGGMIQMWQHAVTLKSADPQVLHDLRAEAHKAFRDANPGPGSFPTPSHVTPGQFQRPYIHEGHAAPSPQHDAPHSFRAPEGQPSAEDYTRGLITEGHASDSPQNDTPRHEPQPAPMTPGKPDRVYYRGTMRDNARQAMTAMHDHISRVFPDVCPMSPELTGVQKPAPQVPEGVGGPAPRASKKAAKAKARKQARAQAAKRRKLERKVVAGKMSISKARKQLGLKPAKGPAKGLAIAKALKARGWTQEQVDTLSPVPSVTPLDPDVIKAAITEANAPLLERIAGQDKTLRKQRKAIDAIASQPDTTQAPLRGVALNKASAAPAGPPLAAESRDLAQAADLMRLRHTWRNSTDPATREAAYRDLTTQLGLTPMTPPT